MTEISSEFRTRLTKLLGMLGSDHAGERDAAGLAAHRLVTSMGMTWTDVITASPEKPLREIGGWRATIAECLEKSASLSDWEDHFLRGLKDFKRISPKQQHTLNEIAARLERVPA